MTEAGSEIIRVSLGNGLLGSSMSWIVVDGIYSYNNRDYSYTFFSIKGDYYDGEDRWTDSEGYLDDSRLLENVFWESPYAPIALSLGEIDEERWLKDGDIVAKNEEWI